MSREVFGELRPLVKHFYEVREATLKIAEVLRCHLLERSGVAITSVGHRQAKAAKGTEREVDRMPRSNLIGDIARDGTNPIPMALG